MNQDKLRTVGQNQEWIYSEGEFLYIYYHVDLPVEDWQAINWLAYQQERAKEQALWN